MLALGLCSGRFVVQSGSLHAKIRVFVLVCLKKLPHKLRYCSGGEGEGVG